MHAEPGGGRRSARRGRLALAALLAVAGAAILAWSLLRHRVAAGPARGGREVPASPAPADPAAPPPASPAGEVPRDPVPAPAAADAGPAIAPGPVPSVRIVDGRTLEPIDITYGWPEFRFRRPDGRLEPKPKDPRRPDAEGRFPVDVPLPADGDSFAGDPRILEVDLPGWEIARLPLAEIRGPVDLPLQPLEVAVAGRLLLPGEETSSAFIEVFPGPGTGRDGAARAGGRLGLDGRFEIRGLPPGTWILRASARWPVPGERWEGERWEEERVARRVFERGGGIADLGEIATVEPVAVRVRVLDDRGEPVGGIALHIIEAEEVVLRILLEGTSGWMTESPVGSLLGRTTPEEGEGWVEIRGLDPGGAYRFLEEEKVIEVPLIEEEGDSARSPPVGEAPPPVRFEILPLTFTTSSVPGESLDVELRRRMVEEPAKEK